MLDIEQMAKMVAEEPADYDRAPLLDLSDGDDLPTDEDELTKAALLRQHHCDHYEVEDPTDAMADDEIFDAMPKPWRKDG